MTKEELNLEELDKANGGLVSAGVYLVITYKDNETDTETKEQRNYLRSYTYLTEILEAMARSWCTQNGKYFVSCKLDKNS